LLCRHFPPSAAIRRAAPAHVPPPVTRAAAHRPVRMCTIRLPTHPCACARSFSRMKGARVMVSGRLRGETTGTVQSLLTEALNDGGGGWQGKTTSRECSTALPSGANVRSPSALLWLTLPEQLRQPGDVGSHPARLVRVADDITARNLVGAPGRGEAAGCVGHRGTLRPKKLDRSIYRGSVQSP
jgi:hypothetical protein